MRKPKTTRAGAKRGPKVKRHPNKFRRNPPTAKKGDAAPPSRVKAEETPAADDPIVSAILESLGGQATLAPRDIAEHIAKARAKPGDGPQLWRRYFKAVKQRAVNLARDGQIEIVRKGEVVDPEDFKGIVRYRLKPKN